MFDKSEIVSVLKEIDKELQQDDVRMEIVVVGYSAIVLQSNHSRGTIDIDVIEASPVSYLRKRGLQLFPEHFFHLLDSYRERLIRIDEGFSHLTVNTLHPCDIALLKIDAGRPKDINDIIGLIRQNIIHLNELEPLFWEWKRRFYDSDESVVNVLNEIKGRLQT